MSQMVALIYEDRPHALTGVKLTLLSIRRQYPKMPIVVVSPAAPIEFAVWAERIPGLQLDTDRTPQIPSGWNAKPAALMMLLGRGFDDVLWIDSDIIVAGDILGRLGPLDDATLVATEEYYWGHRQGSAARTLGLGLQVGRELSSTLNTCILRVTPDHVQLLVEWHKVLDSREYREAQEMPAAQRPLQYFTDLEVLTGLLGSTQFADVPVVALRRGRDIAQCFGPSGFTPTERIRSGRSLPPAVHAMGAKPWLRRRSRAYDDPRGTLRKILEYYGHVHLEVTPYVAAARTFRDELDEDAGWMEPDSFLGRALHRLIRTPALEELPLAVIDSTQRRLRRLLGIRQLKPTRPTSAPEETLQT